MLAANRSAGVTPEVSLRNPSHTAMTKRARITRSPKYQCLQKRTDILHFFSRANVGKETCFYHPQIYHILRNINCLVYVYLNSLFLAILRSDFGKNCSTAAIPNSMAWPSMSIIMLLPPVNEIAGR